MNVPLFVIEVKNQQVCFYGRWLEHLARRIVCYAKEGDIKKQGDELGFIKFGSRVDLYLPVDTELNVNIGDVVTGNRSVIANLNK
jgi:phosphatidylserine decarboxylase